MNCLVFGNMVGNDSFAPFHLVNKISDQFEMIFSIQGKSFLKERSLGHPKHRLQLVFYISIPVFIIAAALIIKQDKIRELCYKGELESERYICFILIK